MKTAWLTLRICVLTTLLLLSSAAPAQEDVDRIETEIMRLQQLYDEAASAAAAQAVIASQPLFHGFVFLEGRYLSPPYIFSWDGAALRLNDVPVPVVPPAAADSRFMHFQRLIARYEQRLRENELMISVDGEPVRFLSVHWVVPIMQILLNDQTWPAKCDALMQIGCYDLHSGQWAALVQRFRPNSEIAERVAALRERLSANHAVAVHKPVSKSVVGGLTIISLALSVIGFATIMNYRPNAGSGDNRQSLRGQRVTLRCVPVFVVLNLFDLACTLITSRAGTLWELNPLANPVQENVTLLAVSKAALTILAATIFVGLRNYRIAQLASWWACLIYTVLVFRWTTFNSLFLN